jgi:hypothetical protein
VPSSATCDASGIEHRSTDQTSVLEVVVRLFRGAERIAVDENLASASALPANPQVLRRWVVPNIGRQLILERCIHGVTE